MVKFVQTAAKKPGKRRIPAGFGLILVVEDDGILAMSIEQALLDGGAGEVVLCNSTEAALAFLRERKPDAIILDVHLADRDDGWAIAELLDDVGPNRPRIVFSTGAPQDIPEKIADLGPVLVKPYEPAELIEAIRGPQRRGLFSLLRRTGK
ncbi:response regulator [Allopontixanthobacter sediminis]|uniref:response regulator n=1 Tax=Allopontixanthobacter sediminis TaxID=1689985 RepID=UPI002FCDA244